MGLLHVHGFARQVGGNAGHRFARLVWGDLSDDANSQVLVSAGAATGDLLGLGNAAVGSLTRLGDGWRGTSVSAARAIEKFCARGGLEPYGEPRGGGHEPR